MKRMIAILLLAGAVLLCSGCHAEARKENLEPHCMITQVTVVCNDEDGRSVRRFSSQESMEVFLNYLRLLRDRRSAQLDPELLRDREFCIILTYPNGNRKIYRQKGLQYLQTDGGAWQQIDPEYAVQLRWLYLRTPSEPAWPEPQEAAHAIP